VERSRALAAARIVEQQAAPVLLLCPVEQRGRLAAGHVRAVAGKENDCRARAGAMSERDLPPVGHWVKLRLSHSGQMATTFRENKRQRFWAKRAISSSSCANSSSAAWLLTRSARCSAVRRRTSRSSLAALQHSSCVARSLR